MVLSMNCLPQKKCSVAESMDGSSHNCLTQKKCGIAESADGASIPLICAQATLGSHALYS